MKRCFLISFFFFSLHSEYQISKCVIHLHSNYSSGLYSLEELIKIAKDYRIDVLIPCDHFLREWEYGVFPLRGVIKKKVKQKSIRRTNIKKYISEIAKLTSSDTIVIAGTEVAPHYFWEGSLFGKLTLKNWHKHMLVIGLNRKDLEFLPVVGNKISGKLNLFLLYPVALIVVAIMLFKRNRMISIFLSLCSFLLLYNNFPYRWIPFDQYSSAVGEQPYQNLINYVNSKNGLIYWAHPESPNYQYPTEVNKKVLLQTHLYPLSLVYTQNYTGFAYFWEGDEFIGKPGGLWDKLLNEYISGKRKTPIFTIGELDYISEGNNNTWMDNVINMLYVTEKTESAILDCLRKGRYYVIEKKNKTSNMILDYIHLTDGVKKASLGETLISDLPPSLKFHLKSDDNTSYIVDISLISNGKIIQLSKLETPAEFVYKETQLKNCYYRIEIKWGNGKLVTNPIFYSTGVLAIDQSL